MPLVDLTVCESNGEQVFPVLGYVIGIKRFYGLEAKRRWNVGGKVGIE
jgi:hypothetical protein